MIHRSDKRLKTLIEKTQLTMKIFPKGNKHSLMDFFYEKLETLFDNPPSNLGYKSDIESILNELGITKEHLLKMSINSLSKTIRNKQEIKIIASYLFFMQDFLKLLKAKGNSEKEQILLKDLLTLSEAMIYEKQKKNTVLLRYGEKGNTAYIILNGEVDVLIESSSIKNMGEKCYLFYLANLIKYQEYGLLNLNVNENFKIFPIDIIDDITIKGGENNIAKKNSIPDNISVSSFNINNENDNKNTNNNNLRNSIKNNKNNIMDKIKKITLPNSIKTDKNSKSRKSSQRKKGEGGEYEPLSSSRKNDSKRESQRGFFKLNFMNEELKELQKVKKYKARELLDMFGLKLSDKKLNKKLNHCNTNDFIERLNIFDYLDKKFKELEEKKIEEERKKEEEKKINTNIGTNIANDINGVIPQKEKSMKEIIQVNIPENKNKNNEEKVSKKKKTLEKKLKNFKSRGSIDKRNSRIHSILNTENDNNEIINDENDDSEESEINDKENKSFVSFSPAFLEEMQHNMVMGLKIYTYIKVATIGTGCLFGEMALTDPNSLRKATIITSSDCHFSVLNKKTFNNCIKIGAQRHLRELLQFFIKLPIFSGIPEGVFYNKYYTNLTKITVLKGKNIVNQGEKPEYITLLLSGQYGVTTFMSLYDLTRLIFRYAKYFNNNNDLSNFKKNNKKENSNNNISLNDIKTKYKMLIKNVLKIMNEENSLLNDNIIFKKFYYSQQLIRISEISCPDIILNDEYLDDNGSFAFSIEAKAPENIIYTMSNKFYSNLRNKNISVKINQSKLLYKKINLMLQRLLIIRNSMINSFFDSKTQKEIGALVIRELNDVISAQLLKRRSLIKKDEIILSSNDNENKENKDKEILIQYNSNTNPYLNSNNLSNSHLIKNRRKNSNKNNNEYSSSIIDFKSYIKNIKNNKKKKKVISTIKLHEQFDKNKFKKIKNNSNNKINNQKLNSLKLDENKKNNNSLNLYKKELTTSPIRRLNLTSRDWKLNNNLPFKDNEDVILYPLYDRTITNERCDESNYINRINYNNSYSNNNISRNIKNEYTQMKCLNENKSTSTKPYFSSPQEKPLFSGACKVEMSNLVWENLKSAAIKERQRLNYFNYNITTANFHKKNKTNKTNKVINFSLKNYLENNKKCITNRNNRNPNLNLPKKNLSNEDNERSIKTNNNDEKDKSKEFSVSNFNVLSTFLSTIKNNNNNNNKIKNSQNINGQKDLLNLKKNKNNDSNFPKIKLNIKKFYSPQEVNLMRISRKMRYIMDGIKYTKIKGDKFKINRKDYYNKNLRNRMNFFYG